jgi:murein DD-endopeptidase MepM/ murein hydrolase activator NlpD
MWAGVLAGRGVVVVDHGDLRTTYEPVAADVPKGGFVFAGDRLGSLQRGHAGCPVAACLHWGLLRGEEYLDPMSLLRRDVRLLPLGAG